MTRVTVVGAGTAGLAAALRAGSVAGPAEVIGVAPAALEATVSQFNLGPVDEAPYYALEVLPGCLGTKGGPRTDVHGRVLSIAGGGPIPRLYAAGHAAASPLGLAYPGAGGTLGPALVFGARAGRAAAEDE